MPNFSAASRTVAAVSLAIVAVAASACRKPRSRTEAAPVRTAEPIVDAARASVVLDAASEAATPDAGRVSPEEEKAAYVQYRAALGRGRAATKAKDWATAVSAFDEALGARPDDARALAERGYARLQAKDLDGAHADLRRAEPRTSNDKALLGQIHFNLGLVAEGRGDDGEAYAAFRASDWARPSAAAKAKVARGKGKEASVCGLEIDQRGHPLREAATWRALATQLAAPSVAPPPATEHASRTALCMPRCSDGVYRFDTQRGLALPDDAGLGCKSACDTTDISPMAVASSDDDRTTFAVVLRDGSKLFYEPVYETRPGRCGGGDVSIRLLNEGEWVHAIILHRWTMATPMCTSGVESTDLHDCGDGDGDGDKETPAGDSCGAPNVSTEQHVILASGALRAVARIEGFGFGDKPLRLSATAAGIAVRGGSCDRVVPWPKSD